MTKKVLISGATSGIGLATAHLLAKSGLFSLVLCGRRLDRLQKFKTQYENINIELLSFDIQNFSECEQALNDLNNEPIDILINNAGLGLGLNPIHEGDVNQWHQMIDTNLKGVLHLTRLISPKMVQRREGHIINIGSIAGKESYLNGNVYNATKFAIDGLSRAMRLDLNPFGVKVSQICPGHVEETEFAQVRFSGDTEKAKIYNDFTPLTSTDIAELIYFMLTRPKHVNLADVLMLSADQASAAIIKREGR